MAAAAASMSNHHHRNTYEVFLSFRGEDTRHSFTAHLYEALLGAGIRTFRDDDEIPRGEHLKPEIEKAIINSKASIIVLSQNYADSRWCLDELWLILEQRRVSDHFVLPVFYHVDPSHVRNQTATFAIQVKDGSTIWTQDNVSRWKSALTEVANLTGMVLSGSEPDFIFNIVDTIDLKLDLKLVSIPANLNGMESRAEDINSWLNNEQSSDEVFAICGMGGSGKTTLAKYIYNLNKQKFESHSFLEEIGKHYKQPHGLLGLQKQLLKDILGGKNAAISNVSEGTSKIEKALQMKRVLIVLDDIDEHDELAALLGTKLFHTQTKIVITSRFLDIDAWFRSLSWRCRVNIHKLLNYHESLELFSFHAFGSKVPMEGFMGLSVQFARYCAGNPLALKVLGSSLFIRSELDPRERKNAIIIWTSVWNSLNSLKGDLDGKIQGVLQKSFDSLPRTSHKELFLHIAIFFVGEDADYAAEILEHDWHAKAGIMTLINKCLLTVSKNNKLMMHHLLQDMGRKIVLEESNDPAQRSRVWLDDESYLLLRNGDGSKTIGRLRLDKWMLQQRISNKPLPLKTSSLAKMDKLKLLLLRDVELNGSYDDFPELRWLCWHRCHLGKIPSGLLRNTLVALDMSYGYLEKFDPLAVLNSLKFLNLKCSRKLASVYNLWRLPNLETLILVKCDSVTYVCNTIEGLKHLSTLNLGMCKKLWRGPSYKPCVDDLRWLKALCIGGGIPKPPLFSLPESLKYLNLSGSDLEYNNDLRVTFHARSFFTMCLVGNPFEFLPSNIDLKTLRVLDLSCCPHLKSLIFLPSTLEELYTGWCASLERITFQSGRFRLRKFTYEGCYKLFEVQGLFKLVSIKKLSKAALGNVKWIKSYEDRKVDLVGDEITKGRIWHIQMLYEYGIRSTYLQGIKDECMMSEYMSGGSPSLSFCVPVWAKKNTIQGLNVISLYSSSGEEDEEDMSTVLLTKISNITKGLTWVYSPLVYCKPRLDQDVVWISYWPIGNILDPGDQVDVSIIVGNGLMVNECGASLVYMDTDQENSDQHDMGAEEVIGGDLSGFEVTTGTYYLCHRDFFKSIATTQFKLLGDNNIDYTNLQEWIKSHESAHLIAPAQKWRIGSETKLKKVTLSVNFNTKREIVEISKTVSKLVGVESILTNIPGRLIVIGHVDPVILVSCVTNFDKIVEVLYIEYGGIWKDLLFFRNRVYSWRYIIISFYCLSHLASLFYSSSKHILVAVSTLDIFTILIISRFLEAYTQHLVYNSLMKFYGGIFSVIAIISYCGWIYLLYRLS